MRMPQRHKYNMSCTWAEAFSNVAQSGHQEMFKSRITLPENSVSENHFSVSLFSRPFAAFWPCGYFVLEILKTRKTEKTCVSFSEKVHQSQLTIFG